MSLLNFITTLRLDRDGRELIEWMKTKLEAAEDRLNLAHHAGGEILVHDPSGLLAQVKRKLGEAVPLTQRAPRTYDYPSDIRLQSWLPSFVPVDRRPEIRRRFEDLLKAVDFVYQKCMVLAEALEMLEMRLEGVERELEGLRGNADPTRLERAQRKREALQQKMHRLGSLKLRVCLWD